MRLLHMEVPGLRKKATIPHTLRFQPHVRKSNAIFLINKTFDELIGCTYWICLGEEHHFWLNYLPARCLSDSAVTSYQTDFITFFSIYSRKSKQSLTNLVLVTTDTNALSAILRSLTEAQIPYTSALNTVVEDH